MTYTNDEKDHAVQQYVQGSPVFTRGALGVRDVENTFNEVSELTKTTMFFEPDAVFYLIYLSSNYYQRKVNTSITIADELLDSIDDLLMPNRPVDNISDLVGARRALQEVQGSLSRNGSISNKAYQRYLSHINRSRDEFGKSVRYSYIPRGSSQSVTDIVHPRDEAVASVVSRFSTLKKLWSEILDGVDQLLAAYGEYISTNIPAIVGVNQIDRAITELENLYSTLDVLTPSERIIRARGSLLNVLSNTSTIKTLATTPLPGHTKVDSDDGYRLSTYGTGTKPVIVGAISAPWPIEDGVSDQLSIDFSGSVVTVDFTGTGYGAGVIQAEVLGSKGGPFNIGPLNDTPDALLSRPIVSGGSYVVSGKTIFITIDGVTQEVSFGANKTAAQAASDINSGTTDILASVYVDGGNDYLKIAYDKTPPDMRVSAFLRVGDGYNNADDFKPWSMIIDGGSSTYASSVSRGWDDNSQLKVQANYLSSITTIDLTDGDWPEWVRTAAQVAADITSAGGTEFEGFYVGSATNGKVGVRSKKYGDGSLVTIRTDDLSGGLETVSQRTALALGFVQDQENRTEDIGSGTIVVRLNKDSNFNAVATASLQTVEMLENKGAVVASSTTITVQIPSATSDPSADWVLAETKLVIRNGDNKGVYSLSSTSWAAPALTLTVNENFRNLSASDKYHVSVISHLLAITSKDITKTSYIQVQAGGTSAHTVLGLDTSVHRNDVTQLQMEYNDPIRGWVAYLLLPLVPRPR